MESLKLKVIEYLKFKIPWMGLTTEKYNRRKRECEGRNLGSSQSEGQRVK